MASQVKMYKIAVLAIGIGELHRCVVAGLKDCFSQYKGADVFEVDIVEVEGTAPSLVEQKVWRIIEQEYDLIVPVGIRCTVGAQKVVNERRYKTPIVFTGVPSPAACGLVDVDSEKREEHVTGISPAQSYTTIPLQLALLLYPKLLNYVIPFRSIAWRGRITFEVERMRKYLRKFGRKVSLVPVKEGDSLGEKLKEAMIKGSIIAIPVGAIPISDLPIILELKKEFKAEILGYADNKVPEDTLLSYKGDADYLGFKVGEYAIKILVDKVSPKDLPVLELDSERYRKIEFNEKQMISRGVPPIDDDLLATLNNGVTRAHYPVYYCSMLDRWGNLLNRAITRNIRAKGNQCTDEAIYGWREIYGNPYDKEKEEHWWRLGCADCFHAVIALGEDELLGVQRSMIKDQEYRPLIHVQYGAQKRSAELKKISADWPTNMPIAQVAIEGPDALMPLMLVDMVHGHRVAAGRTKRKLMTIGLLTETGDGENHPLLQETISTLTEYLALRGGKLIHLHSRDLKELKGLGHQLVKTCDATLLYEPFISLEAQYAFAKYAYKHRHLTCGAGKAGRDLCPVSYGVNPDPIGDAIFCPAREIGMTGACKKMHTHLTRAQAHKSTINPDICKYLDIPLEKTLLKTIKQGLSIEEAVDAYMSGVRKIIRIQARASQ